METPTQAVGSPALAIQESPVTSAAASVCGPDLLSAHLKGFRTLLAPNMWLDTYSDTNWLRNHAAASEQTVLLLIPQRCSATACDGKIRIPLPHR